jgi:hypothetical protein
MTRSGAVSCRCGQVTLQVDGPHIACVECLCGSCRKAGRALTALPGAPQILDAKDATAFVMHRKDRVKILTGAEALKEHRLSADTGTRRVVATCCNTPVFLEVSGGHWLSLYRLLWPDGNRPAVEMRTMAGDLASSLPNDVPNLRSHSLAFYGRLFGAWVRMGFRNPRIVVGGAIDA